MPRPVGAMMSRPVVLLTSPVSFSGYVEFFIGVQFLFVVVYSTLHPFPCTSIVFSFISYVALMALQMTSSLPYRSPSVIDVVRKQVDKVFSSNLISTP